jgi:hypothetical protein
VKERYNCPDCVDTDDESEERNRVYVIPFVGRYVKENGNKRYSWKLRDELKEALKAMALNEEYILTITANSVTSTDPNFTMDNLGLGDNYKPLDAWFEDVSGQKIKRKRAKNERKISNQTLPKLACQIFESQLATLSVQDKAVFPTCQYDPKGKIYKGIYPNIEEFRKNLNSIEYLVYPCANGNQFVIYAWNIFSTILFVQECLKRFGNANEKFVFGGAKFCFKKNESISHRGLKIINHETLHNNINDDIITFQDETNVIKEDEIENITMLRRKRNKNKKII